MNSMKLKPLKKSLAFAILSKAKNPTVNRNNMYGILRSHRSLRMTVSSLFRVLKHAFIFCSASLCALALLAGCGKNDAGVSRAQGIDSIAVFTLHKEPVSKDISFPAELLPWDKALMYAKVSGYVKDLNVDIGDKVKKGELLATLDAPELVANEAQANADVQTARSKYLGSLDAYNRTMNAAKVPGTIAEGEIETVKSQMLADSASLDAARSKKSAFAQLKDYLVIRAPFDGVVTQRSVDPGTLVGTGDTKPMLVVEDISTLRLRIPVPEVYTSLVLDTATADFTVEAQPGVTYKANLSRKEGALNLVNRTETWEFLYDNKSNQLKSGMFANATLTLHRQDSSFVVPTAAEVTSLEKQFVLRLANGTTEWVDVHNGIDLGKKIELFGNLQTGDTILARGTDEIKPGRHFAPAMQIN